MYVPYSTSLEQKFPRNKRLFHWPRNLTKTKKRCVHGDCRKIACIIPRQGNERNYVANLTIESTADSIQYSREGHGWKSTGEVVLPHSINTRCCRQNDNVACVFAIYRACENEIYSCVPSLFQVCSYHSRFRQNSGFESGRSDQEP
jgi:hypothetical protein